MNKNRENVTGAGFLSYLLGSECCNHPSLFSWIAGLAYKQRRDTADSPANPALLHAVTTSPWGTGRSQPTAHTLSERPWKSDCPCPRLLTEAWMRVPHNCPGASRSLCGDLSITAGAGLHVPSRLLQMGSVSSWRTCHRMIPLALGS